MLLTYWSALWKCDYAYRWVAIWVIWCWRTCLPYAHCIDLTSDLQEWPWRWLILDFWPSLPYDQNFKFNKFWCLTLKVSRGVRGGGGGSKSSRPPIFKFIECNSPWLVALLIDTNPINKTNQVSDWTVTECLCWR